MKDEAIKIDLKKISELFLPFEKTIWIKCETPITREEIKFFIDKKKFQNPNIRIKKDYHGFWDLSERSVHIKRIAWLVKNFSDGYPINIDFGIPEFRSGYFDVEGNHRLLAAYYLNKPYIMAYCGGSISEIEKYTYMENELKLS